jgi:hypothetical protein
VPGGAGQIVVRPRLDAAADVEQVPPGAVGRKRLDPELVDELHHGPLGGPDPGAAELDDRAVAEVLVQQLATDPLARLDDQDVDSRRREVAGRSQAREATADDHDVPHDSLPTPLARPTPAG